MAVIHGGAGVGAVGSSNDALMVAIGAVPGAWLRFRVVDHLEPVLPRRHWGTLGVNLIACLALGLIAGLAGSCGAAAGRVLLLVGTGFLGSFSTFSTFSAELRAELVARNWRGSGLLVGGSLAGGLLAMAVGLRLGSQP